MIRLIAFDLWNTLIRNTCHLGGIPSMVRHELGLESVDWRAYIRAYDESFCLRPVDSLEAGVDDLCRRLDIDVPAERRASACRQVEELKECVEPFDDTFGALTRLRQDGHVLVVLTNTNNPALRYALQRAPVQRYVDAIVASCEEGLIKPDVRLFSRMLQRFRTRPHEALMVGDNVHNDVLAARAVGMHAVLLNRTAAGDYPDRIHSLAELPVYVARLPLMPPGSVHAEG